MEGESIKCTCGLVAARKKASDGRWFYGCARHISTTQCRFTRFIPSAVPENALPPTPSSWHSVKAQPPVADKNPTPTSPTPANSLKRNLSSAQEEARQQSASKKRTKVTEDAPSGSQDSTAGLEPPLTPSQKRTKVIEAALMGTPLSELSAEREAPPLPAFSIPSPILSDDLALTGVDLSAVSEIQSLHIQEVRTGTDDLEIQDAVPLASSSQTLAVSGDDSENSTEELTKLFGVANEDKNTWIARTPKRSEQPNASSSRFTGLSSPSPSPIQGGKGGKGKQKASDDDAVELCVGDRREPAPSVVAAQAKGRFTAASISDALKGLEGLPDHVRSLERGHEIKDLKIKHLENEVQRLKARQEELEKMLEMYDYE